MESREENTSWYLTVNGSRVEVTEEVYRAYRFENNRVHKLAWHERRCAQPNFAHCNGDCLSCSWHTSGTLRSIDATVSDYQAELASNECVEDTVLSDLTMRCIYEQAARLVRDGALIFQMHFEEGMSIREIAKHLRVSHMSWLSVCFTESTPSSWRHIRIVGISISPNGKTEPGKEKSLSAQIAKPGN